MVNGLHSAEFCFAFPTRVWIPRTKKKKEKERNSILVLPVEVFRVSIYYR